MAREVNGYAVFGPEEDPVGWLSVQPRLPKSERQMRETKIASIKIELLIGQQSRCAHCHLNFATTTDCHLDHIQPISRGGTNDRANLQLLCRHCSLSKGSKHPDVFEAGR